MSKPGPVFIDGLPGSGKTTLATAVAKSLAAPSRVYLETDPENPLHVEPPRDGTGAAFADIHRRYTVDRFSSRSVEHINRALREADALLIAESFPFQSGVRVLLQIGASNDEIDAYWRDITAVLRFHGARLVLLGCDDPIDLFNRAAGLRGEEWKTYVVEALANTPFSTERGLTGLDAAHHFLRTYAETLDRLAERTSLPTIQVPAVPPSYEQRLNDVLALLNGAEERITPRSDRGER